MEAEDPRTGHTRHVASALVTFVALDKSGKPTVVLEGYGEPDEEKAKMARAKRVHDAIKAALA